METEKPAEQGEKLYDRMKEELLEEVQRKLVYGPHSIDPAATYHAKEIAKILRISEDSVNKAAKAGELHYIPRGTTRKYRGEDVIQWWSKKVKYNEESLSPMEKHLLEENRALKEEIARLKQWYAEACDAWLKGKSHSA